MLKKLIIAGLTVITIGAATSSAFARCCVSVDGYLKGNGTYVAPHIRTYPDGNLYNNLRQ